MKINDINPLEIQNIEEFFPSQSLCQKYWSRKKSTSTEWKWCF